MNFQNHLRQAITFKQWISQNRESRSLLLLSVAVILIQFMCFKYLYSYPNFLPDSYSYIEAAFYNQSINMWPIGYSKFLRLVSVFTTSHLALVFFQYILLQAGILYFIFTLGYQFDLGKWALRILLFLNIINPLLLYVSNFVSSDALFISLSLVWFTQLLWIFYKPTMRLFLIHALLLVLVLAVRYNALYYPLISVTVFMLAPKSLRSRMIGVACVIILLGMYLGQTLYKYREVTGVAQFSAFGGWQLASNALFAYAYVSPDTSEAIPASFIQLHSIVNHHMDSLRNLKNRPDQLLGIYYLWNDLAPLKKYMHYKYRKDSVTTGFNKWASMAPIYSQYGKYIIRKNTTAFLKHYLWPNMVNYYIPDPEFLGMYNMGSDTIEAKAVTWFQLKTNRVYAICKDKKITSVEVFPILLAVINLVFILGFIGFLFLNGIKIGPPHFKGVLLIMILTWLCNFSFSVAASPIVLRYQVFPMVVTLTFNVLLIEFILLRSITSAPTESKYRIRHADVKISL